MKFKKLYLIIFLSITVIIFSCQKENFITDSGATLNFSNDSVQFDTIFSSIGSTTKYFTVINNYKKSIKISSIKLSKGLESNFRLNINGTPSSSVTDIEIPGKDSIFIFVEVTVDPDKDEMIETDMVEFETNGNKQDVDLVAYGQDIHLITDSVLQTQTWTKDKPYLIYKSALVDENQTLTVEAGTKIYFHRNSQFYVSGTLIVTGTTEEPVIFQGDRLEKEYFDRPGQWDGIWLTKLSTNNYINNAVIKNAITGIQVDSVSNENPMLSIHNSIIEHHSYSGILAQNSFIFGTNLQVTDCGYHLLLINIGGYYNFSNCTFGNYYWRSTSRQTPSIYITNYYVHEGTSYVYDLEQAYFGNCIIWGDISSGNEISLNPFSGSGKFQYLFENCLIKLKNGTNSEFFKNNIFNKEPNFKDYRKHDFQLDTLSSAKDIGNRDIINKFPNFLNFDLKNISRMSDSGPDIGAYERVE